MAAKKLIRRYVPSNKKRAVYVATERCNDLVRVFLSLSLWLIDGYLIQRAKIAGIIDEKAIQIGLKVIPTIKMKKKGSKMSIRPFH